MSATHRFGRRTRPDHTTGAADSSAADPRPAASLQVEEGLKYEVPTADDVRRLAGQAAEKGVDNPDVWGENAAQKPALNMIALAVLIYRHILGYDLATKVGRIIEQLELLKARAVAVADDLVRAYDEYELARAISLRLKAKMGREHATLGRRRWTYYGLVVAIAVGEGCMMTVVFQVMALSNHPVVSFLPFVNELSVAASTAILSVLLLADFAGISLRGVLHDVEQATGHVRTRDHEATIRWGKVVGAVGSIAVALVVMFALSAIRSSYFAAANIHTSSTAFVGIQLGFWAAALGLSYLTSGAYDREYKHAAAREREATDRFAALNARFWELVSESAARSHQIRTVTTEAAQHVQVSAADVRRLLELYQHQVRISATEPVTSLMFPEESLPEIRDYTDEELLRMLNGPLALPVIEPIDASSVLARKAECDEYLASLRAELRRAAGPAPASIGEEASEDDA